MREKKEREKSRKRRRTIEYRKKNCDNKERNGYKIERKKDWTSVMIRAGNPVLMTQNNCVCVRVCVCVCVKTEG